MNPLETLMDEYLRVTTTLPYDIMYGNGTGYLDGLVHPKDNYEELAAGQIARMRDDTERLIIVIGTRFGNVVVFQRFIKNSDVVVSNMPDEVSSLLAGHGHGSSLSADQVIHLTGDSNYKSVYPNIGKTIEDMAKLFA